MIFPWQVNMNYLTFFSVLFFFLVEIIRRKRNFKIHVNEEKKDMENKFYQTNLVPGCGEIIALVYLG